MPSISQSFLGCLPRPLLEQLATWSRRSSGVMRLRRAFVNSLKSQDGVVGRGAARGLRFNAGDSDARFLLGTFEPAIQELMRLCLKPGGVFYDVGSNVGFFAMLGSRLTGRSGAVECFEPLPRNAQQIRYNARLNGFENVSVHEVALSERDGTAIFRLSQIPTFGALSDAPMEVDQQSSEMAVVVRSLDSLAAEAELRGPDVIKVDIEGSEVGFLAGAARVIEERRPVLFIELHGTNAAVAEWLRARSYTVDVVGWDDVLTAPWASLAVAIPSGKQALRGPASTICQSLEGR